MTQEDKKLLTTDLIGRLKHKTRIQTPCAKNSIHILNCVYCDSESDTIDFMDDYGLTWAAEDIVPYLRPMSSMTEDELEDFARNVYFLPNQAFEVVEVTHTGNGVIYVKCKNINFDDEYWTFHVGSYRTLESYQGIEWLDANHFDYRGLISRGLALVAPENMY